MPTPSLHAFRHHHDELFQQISSLSQSIRQSGLEPYSDDIRKLKVATDGFLKELVNASRTVSLREDYSWLSETLAKWQLIYSRVFDEENKLELFIPERIMISPPVAPDATLSEEDIQELIKSDAEKIWHYQTREHLNESDLRNWHEAEIYFCWKVIKGDVRFDKNISSNSFYRFENVWLTEVKELVAHLKYLGRRPFLIDRSSTHREDYQGACDELRALLVKEKKAKVDTFLEVKAYIENTYLTGGRYDQGKPIARELLEKKSERIGERIRAMGGQVDPDENWYDALGYLRLFYENIVSAVIDADNESILAIIKAFQFTKTVADKLHVIDAFEVILAIYYLDTAVILSLWDKGNAKQHEPYSAISSFVTIDTCPNWIDIGLQIDLDLFILEDRLWLRGIMFDSQFERLKSHCISDSDEQVLRSLYEESRLVKRLATL